MIDAIFTALVTGFCVYDALTFAAHLINRNTAQG